MSDLTCIPSGSGATLGVRASGEGAPVVFVHGTASDASSWVPLEPHLRGARRCLHYDRSGHGESTDTAGFSLDTEVADLLAVLEHGGPVCDLVAHSYGGLVAMATVTRHPGRVRSLTVYEAPAHFPDTTFARPETVRELERTLVEEGPEAAIVYFMANFPKLAPAAIDALRTAPGWARRVEGAHTIPRELQVAEHFDVDANVRLPEDLPVLLFLGDVSPPPFHASHEHLKTRLPRAVTSVLPGQGHRAMDAVPDIMANTLEDFLDAG